MNNAELDFDTQLHPGSIKSAMKNAGAASRDLWQVAPSEICIVPGFNVRIKDDAYIAHVRSLADSMKAEGFYQNCPIAGYVAKENGKDVIYAYDGHCRLEAVNLANQEGADITCIPVSVSQAGLTMDDMIVTMVRGNSGKSLTTFEKGLVCKRLARAGHSAASIGERLSMSKGYVDDLLLLVAAPAVVRDMVVVGKVSSSVAIEMLKKHGEKAGEKLEKAQVRAGNKKVTGKHVAPEPTLKSEVRACSERMFDLLLNIQGDASFHALTPYNQNNIRDVLKHLHQFN